MNPAHVVAVEDYSEATLRNIVAHLEASTAFEHFIYRESELDAVCRLIEVALDHCEDRPPEEDARLGRLLAAAREAHDLVADERPQDAARRLRQELEPG